MNNPPARERSHWGWGYLDERPSWDSFAAGASVLAEYLGFGRREPERWVRLAEVALPESAIAIPPDLRGLCDTGVSARAGHSMGRSYRDVVRGFRGQFDHPPDAVVRPRDETQVAQVLEWCDSAGLAVIPFGGGTSVVGGVEPRLPGSHNGVVTMDLSALNQILEIDTVSRAARIQAGTLGPDIESQLAPSGLTLRFFPQSFQFSTLGGWIATRAGGHFATRATHIDDLVESIRALTPTGVWESRRLPGSGAGPSPDRMLLGSEGTLGVITSAWVRVIPKPVRRASASVMFADFLDGADAVREIVQAGLDPANCRLIDGDETALALPTGDWPGAIPPGVHDRSLLVLGFESGDANAGDRVGESQVDESQVDESLRRALAICRRHGGAPSAPSGAEDARSGGVGAWRDSFIRAPYLRDMLVSAGVLVETFESAITWDRFPAFHAAVTGSARAAVEDVCGGPARVTCRLTHAYPDGAAPYFTVMAPARRGDEVSQWDTVKAAVSQAILNAGGTITHHHAVGRDHRPWYDQQRPEPFAAALRAAKSAVDPNWLLNPGVLIEPAV